MRKKIISALAGILLITFLAGALAACPTTPAPKGKQKTHQGKAKGKNKGKGHAKGKVKGKQANNTIERVIYY
jgi:hypothetical protein